MITNGYFHFRTAFKGDSRTRSISEELASQHSRASRTIANKLTNRQLRLKLKLELSLYFE